MDLSAQMIADFAVIMTVAALVTFIFHRLNQPLILGYLIAGIIIGPYTPPFSLISRLDLFEVAANLGVILLLFGLGLEFPLGRLRRLGLRAYVGISVIEIALMFAISFGIGRLLGWSFIDSLFLGTALASSSTVIIMKVLGDLGKLKDVSATLMMGILVAEDLIVVVILALMTSIFSTGSATLPGLTWDIGKIVLFIFVSAAVGIWVIPKFIDKLAHIEHGHHLEHDEVLLLIALGLCFGLSIIGNMLGLSLAIGAFMMGVFVASARSAAKIATLVSPIKDMFAAVFFVSMGAFIDLTHFRDFILPALLVTAMMMAGKMLGCGVGTKLFGHTRATALKVGLGMGQIGEFAFIVVKAGQDMDLVTPVLFPTIGIAVGITAFLTPYMIRLSYRMTREKA